MTISRRETLGLGLGAVLATSFGLPIPDLLAASNDADEILKTFTGGFAPDAGKITLTTPEIAENGNTVPITVNVDSPMSGADHVEAVVVVADGNPRAAVVKFNFTPVSGKAAAKTRIRLAKTQNVIAVAKMSDGSFQMAKNEVKVTIGGCGG